jgi:hypothetical protein
MDGVGKERTYCTDREVEMYQAAIALNSLIRVSVLERGTGEAWWEELVDKLEVWDSMVWAECLLAEYGMGVFVFKRLGLGLFFISLALLLLQRGGRQFKCVVV